MPHFTQNLTLGPKAGPLEGARPSKRVKTCVISQNLQFPHFVKNDTFFEMPYFTENLTLGPKTGSLEGARPSKRVKTTNFSLKCGTFTQYVIFSKSAEIGDSLR